MNAKVKDTMMAKTAMLAGQGLCALALYAMTLMAGPDAAFANATIKAAKDYAACLELAHSDADKAHLLTQGVDALLQVPSSFGRGGCR